MKAVVLPKVPRPTLIRYVDETIDLDIDVECNDVDQDAPTIPLKSLDAERAQYILDRIALRKRSDTLSPISADATLERFVASAPSDDDSDADITLRMDTTRELRVRAIARRAVGFTVAAALAILTLGALRTSPTSVAVVGMDHQNPRHDVGTLSITGVTGLPVFVDGERAFVAPGPSEVACGARRVQIGEKGSTRVIDIPCDGRVDL